MCLVYAMFNGHKSQSYKYVNIKHNIARKHFFYNQIFHPNTYKPKHVKYKPYLTEFAGKL